MGQCFKGAQMAVCVTKSRLSCYIKTYYVQSQFALVWVSLSIFSHYYLPLQVSWEIVYYKTHQLHPNNAKMPEV